MNNLIMREAVSRLDNADRGFNALTTILASGDELVSTQDMFHLLEPLISEVHTALEDLRNL